MKKLSSTPKLDLEETKISKIVQEMFPNDDRNNWDVILEKKTEQQKLYERLRLQTDLMRETADKYRRLLSDKGLSDDHIRLANSALKQINKWLKEKSYS